MLTAKGAATRQRIVAVAAEQIRTNGIAATTLDDVAARSRTSKGQIFHYFPDGKDELLVAVAQYEADRVLGDQQPHLGLLDSWVAWQRWADAVVERYERQGPRCPLGVLLTEIGRSSPAAQQVTTTLLQQWQDHLAAGVQRMQERGLVSVRLHPQRSAAAIIAGVQGGVVLLMTTGSSDHLRAALDASMVYLRSP